MDAKPCNGEVDRPAKKASHFNVGMQPHEGRRVKRRQVAETTNRPVAAAIKHKRPNETS